MRVFNRLASLVLGLAVAAGGLLLAVEAVSVWTGGEPALVPLPGWYAWLRSVEFADGVVLLAAVAAAVLGLVLVVAQLRPWRPVRVPAEVDDNWYVQRRGVERGLVRAVEGVPGVTEVKARVGKRWRCRVRAVGDVDSQGDVDAAVDEELRRLSAQQRDRVAVRLIRRRRVT